MRLLELEIENFGIFSGKQLQFGDGFQLISGPNEAGKSTLLQIIREVFFGFPHSSPYLFAGHSGEMAATALLALSDGREVRYRRRKGTKATVLGNFVETGDPVNEATLTSVLGNANADLYSSVFGFSLAELAAGEKSLSQTDLSEALYGGGLGGLANLQKLREDIRAEQEGLFSPGASKREINRLVGEIKDKRRAVTEATVKPRDYQKLREETTQLQEEVEEVRRRREGIQRKQTHLKRLASALPSWLRLQVAREELSQLQAPAGFPTHGEERFRAARQRRDELAEELEQARSEVTDLSDKLDAIEVRPELVAKEAEVKRLEREVGRMRQYAAHIPQRSQESATIKEAVLARVKQLNPQWDLAQLDQFQTSLAQRDAIEALEQELHDIQRQQDKLESRRPDLIDEITRKECELEQMAGIESVPTLERLVECASVYQADRDAAADLMEQVEDADANLGMLRQQLESPLGTTIENAAELPIPLTATLKKYREDLVEIDNSLRDAARRLEEAEQNTADKRRDLLDIDSQVRIPDREQLLTQRERRDAGWRLIRRKHVTQDPNVNEEEVTEWLNQAGGSLPDQYEREVETADQLADQRQEKAETVARREHIAAEITSAESRTANLYDRRTQLEGDRQQLQTQWENVWNACGFTPLSPDEMLEWVRIHEDYHEETRQQTKRRLKLVDVNHRIADFEAELVTAVGGNVSCDQQLAEARRRTEAARRAATRREQYQAELPQRKRQLAELDRQIDDLSKRREDWGRRWRGMLGQFDFPEDWSVGTATKILGGLAEARQEHSKVVSLDKRIVDMQAESKQYRGEVVELCQAIAPDLAELPAEDAVERLAQRIQEAKQAAHNQEAYGAQHEKSKNLVVTKETQIANSNREIEELLNAAGVTNEAAFEEAAGRARRHKELSEEIEQLDRDVKRIAAEEDVDHFLAELREAKQDDVNVQRQRADEECQEIETTYQDKLEKAALARDRLEKLDRASEAAKLAQELESERAQMAAAVDRWAPLVLAQALLSEAIERFEREHQPEMLLDIGRLFSQMTRGRYTGVRRKLDERGTLLLELRDGSYKEPHELSTGTREQLYLAMRLAYVRHYCREAEPLPLVMDDVLVNFDDERAYGTLGVLLEVANDMQIIFMTCHRNIVDLITAAAPEMKPIYLTLEAIV